MNTTTKRKNTKKTVKRALTKQQKIDKLVKEIQEAKEESKNGSYVKGDVDDIMKAIRNYKDET